MTKYKLIPVSITLALMVMIGGCWLVLPESPDHEEPIGTTNLLTNGDFENELNGWLTTGEGTFVADGHIKHNGLFSASITALNDMVEPSIKQEVLLEPKRYKFTGYYRADSVLAAQHTRVQVMFMQSGEHFKINDVDHGDMLESATEGTKLSIYWDFLWIEPDPDYVEPGEWKRLEAVIDLRNYPGLIGWFELKLWRQAGTLWWDDITLVPLAD